MVVVDGKLDVSGDATFDRGVVMNISTAEIEVDGSTTMSGGTISIGDGTFDANGAFNASGATIQMSDGNLTLGRTVTSLGTLDELEGTVTYDGATQTVLNDNYFNLVISTVEQNFCILYSQ